MVRLRVLFFLVVSLSLIGNLLFYPCRVYAAESIDDQLIVVGKGDGKFVREVLIRIPDAQTFEVKFAYEKSSTTFGRFEGTTSAILYDGKATLSRGKTKNEFLLKIEKSTAEFEIQIGKTIYLVNAESEFGVPKSKPAPPPIPWNEFLLANQTEVSPLLRDKALHASVRVITPSGLGSGTIIEVPREWDLRESIRDGEQLIVTAAHVTPEYFTSVELAIDVFEYQNEKALRYTRCPARCLFILDEGEKTDIAVLAAKIPTHLRFERLPIATENHWFVYRTEYLQIGCPGGNDPVLEVCRPVQGNFAFDGGTVTVDKASKQGQSGGGLISPDGYLVGVLSATGEASELVEGAQLLYPDLQNRVPREIGRRTLATSIFFRPVAVPRRARLFEGRARENTRWMVLRLPIISPHGISNEADVGLVALRAQLSEAVKNLPTEESRKEVEEKFKIAIEAYERALRK